MSARHVVTRARRQAAVSLALDRRTAAVRALSTGTATPMQARATADTYARACGLPRATDATLVLLCSPRGSRLSIDELDELLIERGQP